MKRKISVILIIGLVIGSAIPVHATNYLGRWIGKYLGGIIADSQLEMEVAVFEESLRTIEKLTEKKEFITEKQLDTLKNTLDDWLNYYGKDYKTKNGKFNSVKSRLKNKGLTVNGHKTIQEWLDKAVWETDLHQYLPQFRYRNQFMFGPLPSVAPSLPAPVPSLAF